MWAAPRQHVRYRDSLAMTRTAERRGIAKLERFAVYSSCSRELIITARAPGPSIGKVTFVGAGRPPARATHFQSPGAGNHNSTSYDFRTRNLFKISMIQ